jgi:hypothetical protein
VNDGPPTTPPRRAHRRFLALLAVAALVALAVAAVGYLPSRNLAGDDGVVAMLVALAVCWLGSAIGAVPVLLAERAAAGRRLPPAVSFGSMLTRLLVVLGLTVAAALSGWVVAKPLLVWTALAYLALLTVDTWYVLGATKAPQ